MYMDMQDGPSSSFHNNRGRGGRNDSYRGGSNYRAGYQGGRDGSRGRGGGRGNFDQYDNTYRPPGARYDDEGHGNGNSYRGGGFGGGSYDRGGPRTGPRQPPRGRNTTWGSNTRGGSGGRDSRGGGGGRAGPRGGVRQAPRPRPFQDQPKDVEYVTMLKGHTEAVTALAYNSSASQLYTGSNDATVRVWDCPGGTCASVVDVGGRVDSLLLEGDFLFVGLHVPGVQPPPGLIRVWHLVSGAQHDLAGHTDQVLALAAANNCLFSGGKDMSIRVWSFDMAAGTFAPSVVITAAQGGHTAPVQALLPFGQWLVSADWLGNLKVWDMASGACAQTIQRAHTDLIMGLLAWDNVLVSCSLDCRIKVWNLLPAPTPGAVLDANPVYTHPPADSGIAAEEWGGVLAVCGALDGGQRPLLLASYNADGCVRMWDLPGFTERGSLPAVKDARALAAVPGDILVAGDQMGTVKLWRWRPAPMPLA